MDFQNLTREEIVKISETSSELIGALILYLWDENQNLKQRVKELEGRLNQNGSNSGKPADNLGIRRINCP